MHIDWLLGEDLWAWGCGNSSPHVRLACFATEYIYIMLYYCLLATSGLFRAYLH